MRLNLVLASALLATPLLLAGRPAAALGLTISGSTTKDSWDAESGQSIPTGTNGFVDGTLNATTAGMYNFTFGPNLLAGATGYGNAGFTNEFWVGTSRAAAESAGHYFCNHGCAAIGLSDSTVGQTFSVNLAAGAISYGFSYNQTGQNGVISNQPETLLNGATLSTIDANGRTIQDGATLVETATSFSDLGPGYAANAGANPYAFIGLSDQQYPAGDHDFQDLSVMVSTPEPASMALLGFGLVGLGALRRRRN